MGANCNQITSNVWGVTDLRSAVTRSRVYCHIQWTRRKEIFLARESFPPSVRSNHYVSAIWVSVFTDTSNHHLIRGFREWHWQLNHIRKSYWSYHHNHHLHRAHDEMLLDSDSPQMPHISKIYQHETSIMYPVTQTLNEFTYFLIYFLIWLRTRTLTYYLFLTSFFYIFVSAIENGMPLDSDDSQYVPSEDENMIKDTLSSSDSESSDESCHTSPAAEIPSLHKEAKYIVFFSSLLNLISMCCCSVCGSMTLQTTHTGVGRMYWVAEMLRLRRTAYLAQPTIHRELMCRKHSAVGGNCLCWSDSWQGSAGIVTHVSEDMLHPDSQALSVH